MFRRSKTLRGRSVPSDIVRAFEDPFWTWYIDSFTRIDSFSSTSSENMPFNPKKYSNTSSAVVTIKRYFETLKLPVPSNAQIIALLKSPFTAGDLPTTFQLIRYFQLAQEGLFLTNETNDKLGLTINYLGAENWENVMCYMDALLFAMFANLESFEPILFVSNQHSSRLVDQLSALLRLYVSLLRSGNLITTDISIRICENLQKLGFKEAMSHQQQDCTDLFEFLTETLAMPLLTFKINIKHGGKFKKEDDEKYSRERILFVSIPGDEQINNDSKDNDYKKDEEVDSILLEECLEHYFNNSISVKRELERRATLESLKFGSAGAGDVTMIPEDNIESTPCTSKNKKFPEKDYPNAEYSEVRDRSNSISSHSKKPYITNVRTRSSNLSIWSLNDAESVKTKEVSLPAWMFLRLLPFYTDNNCMDQNQSIATNSREFVNRRPILPICLKRYSFSNSSSQKSKRRIVIPPVIHLPNFVADDCIDNSLPSGNFRLVLESAICHRGTSIKSGHFVSAVRKEKNDSLNKEGDESTWLLYDDMKRKSRVVEKTFKEIFETEWPYMLFYRLVSNEEEPSNETMVASSSSNTSSKSIDHSMIIQPGSKSKYWKDEPLNGNGNGNGIVLDTLEINEDINTCKTEIKHADELQIPLAKDSSFSSGTSMPIPETSPIDPRYIDIRNKYFWYVIDKDKNYYKELSIPSRTGTRDNSIVVTPQFRRNSQWSEPDGDNNSEEKKLEVLANKICIEEHSESKYTTSSAKWKIPRSSQPDFASPASEATVILGAPSSSTPTTTAPQSPDSHHHHMPFHIHRTVSPVNLDEEEKKHIFRKNKKRGDEYRREKCVIT